MEPFDLVNSPRSLLPLAADEMLDDVADYAEVDNMADDATHQDPTEGQTHFVDAQEEEEDLVPNEDEVVDQVEEEEAAAQIDSKENTKHSLGAYLDPTHQDPPDEGQVHLVDAQEKEEEDLVPNEDDVEEKEAAGQIDSKEKMKHYLGAYLHLQRIVAKREDDKADVNAQKRSKDILSMLKQKTKERKLNPVPKLNAEALLLQPESEEPAMVRDPIADVATSHTAVADMADADLAHRSTPGEEQVHFVNAQEGGVNLVPRRDNRSRGPDRFR